MKLWNQCRLIDILSGMDLSLLEGRFPETDLERGKPLTRKRRGRVGLRIAVISGLAAVPAALTGMFLFLLRKRKRLCRRE